MSLQLVISIAVVLFVVGWFAAGTHINVRKGEQAMVWLQQGLPLLGEKTTLRWLGSSVVELKIPNAKPPFRDAEVLVVLEPRDVAPLWWVARLRGRRDLLVVRGALQRVPKSELDAADPRVWTLGRAAQTTLSTSSVASSFEGLQPVRICVRRNPPYLELQWRLEHARSHPSHEVVELARGLANADL
ncbi:MAG: hypothetical protein ACR2IF_00405 [Terriglobales bacterium]